VAIDDAAGLLRRHWAIEGSLSVLPSERDRNFRVDVEGDPRYVLKVANLAEDATFLDLQDRVMTHVAGSAAICQRPVPATDGRLVIGAGDDAGPPLVRLLTWLPGVALAEVPIGRRTPGLFRDLGGAVARLSILVDAADAGELDREFQWDVLRHEIVIGDHADAVDGRSRREVVAAIRRRLRTTLAPTLDDLPRSLIHNDANDHNVLVDARRQTVTGFLDFGDMVHSVTVNEAAVAAAYALLGAARPLDVVACVAQGFGSVRTFSPLEQATLFELVIARLATSVVLSAHQARLDPSDPYLWISEAPAWAALERLMAIDPDTARDAIAAATR
jgi:Ser/Thr protein kinase RdoA (MazF antagonist)